MQGQTGAVAQAVANAGRVTNVFRVIILGVFSLNADELANAVYSPDMTCGESVLSLGAMRGGGRI